MSKKKDVLKCPVCGNWVRTLWQIFHEYEGQLYHKDCWDYKVKNDKPA